MNFPVSIIPPTTFLSLAPTTSSSFPAAPVTASSSSTAPETPEISETLTANPSTTEVPASDVTDVIPVAVADAVSDEVHDARGRRSSSLSSDVSTLSAKRRFLKLGPVFYGVGDGKGKGDWSEEVLTD